MVDEKLIKSIDNLQSRSKNKDDMDKIEKVINKIRHDDYKKYMKNYYDSKVASLK